MNKVSLETRQKRIIENRKRWLYVYEIRDNWNAPVELSDEYWQAYVGAIKLYATQMINDNTGLYAEIVEMPTDAIINGLAASDEIKAVICAHILCEDTSVLTDSQLIKIRGLLIDWLKKARYFTPAFSSRFDRCIDGITSELRDRAEQWYCQECNTQFADEYDFNNHIEYVPGTSYYDPPEERCRKSDEYSSDDYADLYDFLF